MGFVFALVVAALINCVTALFSRKHALKLIPWMCLYISLYGLFVSLTSNLIWGYAMTVRSRTNPYWSYPIVILLFGLSGAAFWYAIGKANHHLASATKSPDSSPELPSIVPKSFISQAASMPTADEIADTVSRKLPPTPKSATRAHLKTENTIVLISRPGEGGVVSATYQFTNDGTAEITHYRYGAAFYFVPEKLPSVKEDSLWEHLEDEVSTKELLEQQTPIGANSFHKYDWTFPVDQVAALSTGTLKGY